MNKSSALVSDEDVVLMVTRIVSSHNLSLLDFLRLGEEGKLKNPELRELYENSIDFF
jgi:hypothetical protein